MTIGLSLNIGLNKVDPNHYEGWDGQLSACEFDADDMAEIARAEGFEIQKLITTDATVKNVVKNITDASEKLESGDIFLLTYSGHGGKLKDLNRDEKDFEDETWCLYDRQFVDDELNDCLSKFKEGVRIFVLSDSCHSGTVIREINGTFIQVNPQYEKIDVRNTNVDKNGVKYRFVPDAVLNRVYSRHKGLYDQILSDKNLKESEDKVKASAILISGCQDNQFSQDGTYNGLFTANLLNVWDDGQFKDSYKTFHKRIVSQMPSEQTPNYYVIGKPNLDFEKKIPFKI